MDINQIMNELQENEQTKDILAQMRTAKKPKRKQAPVVSSSTAKLLEQAAKAAERGDTAEASRIVGQVANTPDGKVLAEQLSTLFSQKE